MYNINSQQQLDFQIMPVLSIFPKTLYEMNDRGTNDFQMSGMTVLESQTNPTSTIHHPGSAGTTQHEIYSPIEQTCSSKCT
jgi:hypothetical protein